MQRQILTHKLTSKLSPQQIQLMKMLQIPTSSLEERVQEELEANPALEEGYESSEDNDEESDNNEEDDVYLSSEESSSEVGDEESTFEEEKFELDDYLMDYVDDDPVMYSNHSRHTDEEEKTIPITVETSFHEYLTEQLGLRKLDTEKQNTIAKQIIGTIDEDGYLRRDPRSISNDLMLTQNLDATEDEVIEVLRVIQKFDPPGVGARDLRECLLIQLDHYLNANRNYISLEQQEVALMAIKIIKDYFDEFTKKHYTKLQRSLSITSEELKEVVQLIISLNPKPASGYAGSGKQPINYVVPDFTINNRDGELELTLNTINLPDLHVNDQYKDMLKSFHRRKSEKGVSKKEKEAVLFIKRKIDSAKWFIDAIRQRYDTMMRTMYAIMQYQYEYFLTGDSRKIHPMILKDISEITGLDISTVSRVVNSKYVQTEFGTKSLKEFFSESLQTSSGEEVSTLEVKKILEDIVDDEDKRHPLSDERLKSILKEKGYNIARRTVAKYREQLNIPVARLRKEL